MAPLRHVGAAVLRSCRHSGRAAPLRPSLVSPPTAASSRSSADSVRLISSGRGDLPPLLRQYWDTSRTWIRDTTQKYKTVLEEFKEADEHLKTALQGFKYLYVFSGAVISGVIYLVDQGVDTKINKKVDELLVKIAQESASRGEFQRRAVTDFQEHVSKIQYDVSQLRQKILDNQESELEHRQQIMSAVHFFKINGYVFVPLSEFNDLVTKVKELEHRSATTTAGKPSKMTGQVPGVTEDDGDAAGSKPSKMTEQVSGVTDIIAASPHSEPSKMPDKVPGAGLTVKRTSSPLAEVDLPAEDDGDAAGSEANSLAEDDVDAAGSQNAEDDGDAAGSEANSLAEDDVDAAGSQNSEG